MSEPFKLDLSRREFCLLVAGLMSAEDAPDAFSCGLKALGQPAAKDREVVELGERILAQLDPDRKIV